MERPDSAASDVGGANRHHDILKGSLDSDHEAQLHYGKLVSKIRKMKDQCEHKIQKIDAERNALPDMEILEKNVKETAEKVAEFRRVYEEACQSAETARKDLEVTTNKISEIENAEREVEQLKAVSKELRSQLGID
jgi:vacuolar-type H+-ATPase subunit I/STV1